MHCLIIDINDMFTYITWFFQPIFIFKENCFEIIIGAVSPVYEIVCLPVHLEDSTSKKNSSLKTFQFNVPPHVFSEKRNFKFSFTVL